jgi:acetyl-CoA carboxylase carboxyl transferase subunit alpha
MFKNGLIDGIIEEPLGGAHNDIEKTIATVKKEIKKLYKGLKDKTTEDLINERIEKFSQMGVVRELEA